MSDETMADSEDTPEADPESKSGEDGAGGLSDEGI
jgi:hypothetical protein